MIAGVNFARIQAITRQLRTVTGRAGACSRSSAESGGESFGRLAVGKHSAESVDDRVLFRLKAGLINGEANSHIFPAVIELFSAVQTDDIRSTPRTICRLRPAGWGERKGCPVMGTTKKGTEQRIKHENKPPRIHLFGFKIVPRGCKRSTLYARLQNRLCGSIQPAEGLHFTRAELL
jgi:hypothetical protein